MVSGFRILTFLKKGGYGDVYLAASDYSERAFVIKFLSPEHLADEETKRRFQREAEAASELRHHNICSLLDNGVYQGRPYILMEYVKGETLRTYIAQRRIAEFSLYTWLDIAIQLGEALLEAHKRGITHRDIKPENIMITPERQAKILDWGLAKLPEPRADENPAEIRTKLTKPDELLGTDPYMSPEQARRESVDSRSDIFSFGVVLYEIFSGGINPFDKPTPEATLNAIKTEEPKSLRSYNPTLHRRLARIVGKALNKDLKRRYQKTEKLLADLKNLKKGLEDKSLKTQVKLHARFILIILLSVIAIGGFVFFTTQRGRGKIAIVKSIAVVPLANKSADLNVKYLCDQITDNLINNLTHVADLRVISRDTAFGLEGKETDPQRVGRDLGVGSVLTGTISSQDGKLVLRLSLIRTSDGIQRWGDSYEWERSDVVAVQRSINKASEELTTELTGNNQSFPWRHIIDNTEAYNLYQEGRFYLGKRNVSHITKSIAYFEQSLAKDPKNALAHVGIADAYILLGSQGYSAMSPAEALPKARSAAIRALEIDNTLGEAVTSLALIKMLLDLDWKGAEEEFRRAISINPGYATAHHWYANYLISQGRGKEAESEIALAQQLDPNSLIISATIGWIYYFEGRYDDAIDQCKRTLDKQSDFYPAHAFLAFAYEQKGDLDSAIEEFQLAKKISNDNPVIMEEISRVEAESGKNEQARKGLEKLINLRKLRYVPADGIALIYAELDDNDGAFTWLAKACDEHAVGLAMIKVEPKFRSLQPDARFMEIMRRMRLSN